MLQIDTSDDASVASAAAAVADKFGTGVRNVLDVRKVRNVLNELLSSRLHARMRALTCLRARLDTFLPAATHRQRDR